MSQNPHQLHSHGSSKSLISNPGGPVLGQTAVETDFQRLLGKPVVALQLDKVVPPQVDKRVNWERHFQLWRERCGYWLRSERGRCSDLARHLAVSRQTVWRWFFSPWSSFPGWAAVACNVYYYERQPREADQILRQRQKEAIASGQSLELPKLRAPSQPRLTNFVAGSEDNDEGGER